MDFIGEPWTLLLLIPCFLAIMWITAVILFFIDVPRHLKKSVEEQRRIADILENIDDNLMRFNEREELKDTQQNRKPQ